MNVKKWFAAVVLFFLTIANASAEMVSRQAVMTDEGPRLVQEPMDLMVDDSLTRLEIKEALEKGKIIKQHCEQQKVSWLKERQVCDRGYEVIYDQASGTVRKFPLPASAGTPTVRFEFKLAFLTLAFVLLGSIMPKGRRSWFIPTLITYLLAVLLILMHAKIVMIVVFTGAMFSVFYVANNVRWKADL